MNIRVITSMNRDYYKRCGSTMIDSFIKYWPNECNLVIYTERKFKMKQDKRRLIQKDLFELQPGCKAFVKRNKKRPDQQNSIELHLGAVRFCYKSYSITHAGLNSGGVDCIIWLDADTFTFEKITIDFLLSLADPNKYVTYLGRSNNYSETGFVMYNCNYFQHRDFMERYQKIYDTDDIFKLPQWHDCMVFDVVRVFYEKKGMQNINLSPEGKDYDHVFVNSVLGNFIDHMKGDSRKDVGRSGGKDFKLVPPDHEYWNDSR